MKSEEVNVNVVTPEILAEEVEKLLRNFMKTPEGQLHNVSILKIRVIPAPSLGETLVITVLKDGGTLGVPTGLYAGFMFAHKEGAPPDRLFPIGYKVLNSLDEVDSFIAMLEFEIAKADAHVNTLEANA